VDADEDVSCGFCVVKWDQSASRGNWIKCQMCGKWYHGLCIGAQAVHLWKMPVSGIAPPGDRSYRAFL
jgi:hypothetical protein